MNPPQAVSSKYARNLICNGANSTFELERLEQKIATTPSGVPIGYYYQATIKFSKGFDATSLDGATPESAVTACLQALGVTFR